MTRFAVVVLNWNGASDTIDCVRSIRRFEPDAVTIIIDNGSSDDSIPRMQAAFRRDQMRMVAGAPAQLLRRASDLLDADIVLVPAGENLGFAIGCNLGLTLAAAASFDITVFLNNDTEVDGQSLAPLADRVRNDPQWFAVLPRIMIHGTNRIWNCGGNISRLGLRRYNFPGAELGAVTVPNEIACSFFTGCCFAVRTAEFLARYGFTDRFFFGEEDFELSLWMKDHDLRALCLTSSVVQHKVSSSISRASGSTQASKVFVYYLNRFIHMRTRLGDLRWSLWLVAYVPYITALLGVRRIVPAAQLHAFILACVARAKRTDRVTRADFEAILKERAW